LIIIIVITDLTGPIEVPTLGDSECSGLSSYHTRKHRSVHHKVNGNEGGAKEASAVSKNSGGGGEYTDNAYHGATRTGQGQSPASKKNQQSNIEFQERPSRGENDR
jgi:hypothetical protein